MTIKVYSIDSFSFTIFKMHITRNVLQLWHRQDFWQLFMWSMQCLCVPCNARGNVGYVGLVGYSHTIMSLCFTSNKNISLVYHLWKSTQTTPTTAERWMFSACKHCSYLVGLLKQQVERRKRLARSLKASVNGTLWWCAYQNPYFENRLTCE